MTVLENKNIWNDGIKTSVRFVATVEIFFQYMFLLYHGNIAVELSVMLYVGEYSLIHPIIFEKVAYNSWYRNLAGLIAWSWLTLMGVINFFWGFGLAYAVITSHAGLYSKWRWAKATTTILSIFPLIVIAYIDFSVMLIAFSVLHIGGGLILIIIIHKVVQQRRLKIRLKKFDDW